MSRTDLDPATGGGPEPLAGRRIVVVRGGAWGDRVADRIRERGGEAIVVELLRIAPPRDPEALAAAVGRWNRGDFDWAVVTSANGAEAFVAAGGRSRAGSRIAAVGPATAASLERIGLAPDLVPDRRFSGAGVVDAILEAVPEPSSFLLPLSEIAADTVETALLAAGHRVERVDAYRTVSVVPDETAVRRVSDGGVDAILVTSGSAARAIAQHLGGAIAAAASAGAPVRLAAIGGPSSAALREAGLRADVVAETHTIPGLLDALAAAHRDPERSGPEHSRPASVDPHRSSSPDHAEGESA